MSYQLYVTGGYGFTEAILPTLLHPSNAVDIAWDYFTRGYQGLHIDLPPDADVSQTGNLTDTRKQTLLEDLQEGRLVLSSRYEPGFALFTETQASPDTLRNDLPPTLRNRLQQQWPGRSQGGAAAARSDSLALASEPITHSPEPPAPESPVPGIGPYNVTLAYRWPDGTGVAGLPFTLATDDEGVTGTLDANGEARIERLNGRFASVRLSSDASDDEVGHQRRAIQHTLTEILKREQKEADSLAREYQQMPWHQRTAVSTGAAFQGVVDAGIGLLRFANGMIDPSSPVYPSKALMDGLKSAWAASEDSPDTSWYDSFRANYDEARHQRWVKALGFNPTDISRGGVAEAYELTNLVMADPMLRESLNDFVAEYARIQHHTEVTYFTGAVAFDLIFAALLAVATGGVAAVGAAAGRIRHAGLLASLGKTVKAYGAAVRKQRLRYLWRSTDLKSKNHLEARASKRVEGQELKSAEHVPDNKPSPTTMEAGRFSKPKVSPHEVDWNNSGPNGLRVKDPRDFVVGSKIYENLLDKGLEPDLALTIARELLESGVGEPSIVRLKSGDKLYKVVPKNGAPPGENSPYFMAEEMLKKLPPETGDAGSILGLPQIPDAFDIYSITAKTNVDVFQSEIAPFSVNGGEYIRPGGGTQTIVTNRDQFTAPSLLGD